MKIFSLVLFLISINSFAGFVAGSKINQCDRVDYSEPASCSEIENEACYKVPDDSGECGIFELKDIYGNIKFDEETCSGQVECQELLSEKVCGVDRVPFINLGFTEVYCVEVISKEMVVNQSLKASKDIQKAQLAQVQAIIESGKKAREACERVLDLIGGFNLLNPSGSQAADSMVSTFANAKQYLSDGRPGKAKYAIQQIPVSALVSQQMKDLALAQLSEYEAVP